MTVVMAGIMEFDMVSQELTEDIDEVDDDPDHHREAQNFWRALKSTIDSSIMSPIGREYIRQWKTSSILR